MHAHIIKVQTHDLCYLFANDCRRLITNPYIKLTILEQRGRIHRFHWGMSKIGNAVACLNHFWCSRQCLIDLSIIPQNRIRLVIKCLFNFSIDAISISGIRRISPFNLDSFCRLKGRPRVISYDTNPVPQIDDLLNTLHRSRLRPIKREHFAAELGIDAYSCKQHIILFDINAKFRRSRDLANHIFSRHGFAEITPFRRIFQRRVLLDFYRGCIKR